VYFFEIFIAHIQVPQCVSMVSGGSEISGASVLNNTVRDGAFKKTRFTLDINLTTPENLTQISSAILCIAWAKQVTCTILKIQHFISSISFYHV